MTSDTVTVRYRAGDGELDVDADLPCPDEVSRWGMFGIVDLQTVTVDGTVHTTVRPRSSGGARALVAAVHESDRHIVVTAVTES